MITPRQSPTRPTRILLPVQPWFIAITLALAFLLNLLPWGRWVAVPDFVALVLVFWNIHHPRRVGIGVAFLLGIAMDVHEAAVLGQHALAYALLSYGAISLHRRVLWFTVGTQALHMLPLFLVAQLVSLLVRMAVGDPFPGVLYFLESLSQALLWPIATALLLAPQRRAIDKDETRPI
ncbi:rod shape-determining protein MreD [Piscinibacterium candidicorallinum]|jgi:rod shape-determining protein MreD|uniref:Rod shape-determining protein MreD n=1 Tax=Piscinibacterium candidicorallinum TaxID=1793872 RepID=A0ABV7H499_9BURK